MAHEAVFIIFSWALGFEFEHLSYHIARVCHYCPSLPIHFSLEGCSLTVSATLKNSFRKLHYSGLQGDAATLCPLVKLSFMA